MPNEETPTVPDSNIGDGLEQHQDNDVDIDKLLGQMSAEDLADLEKDFGVTDTADVQAEGDEGSAPLEADKGKAEPGEPDASQPKYYTTDELRELGEKDLDLDTSKIPPEYLPVYKSFQKGFTKKTTDLATQRKEIDTLREELKQERERERQEAQRVRDSLQQQLYEMQMKPDSKNEAIEYIKKMEEARELDGMTEEDKRIWRLNKELNGLKEQLNQQSTTQAQVQQRLEQEKQMQNMEKSFRSALRQAELPDDEGNMEAMYFMANKVWNQDRYAGRMATSPTEIANKVKSFQGTKYESPEEFMKKNGEFVEKLVKKRVNQEILRLIKDRANKKTSVPQNIPGPIKKKTTPEDEDEENYLDWFNDKVGMKELADIEQRFSR